MPAKGGGNSTMPDSGGKSKRKRKRVRPPRSAAIVLTLSQDAAKEGRTYAGLLAEAKGKIDLSELGVESLRFKVAQTGGRILEVPGADGAAKADRLAEQLRTILPSQEVRVSRPVKTAEIRLTGLDDSITEQEIVSAVGGSANNASQGSGQIKVGTIRRTPSGSGSTVVRCPIELARQVAAPGRLKIGWVSVRVQLLDARPLQCYRCLEKGHTSQRCQAEKDRSGRCYRCGELGHIANGCSAQPFCLVCKDQGKPAEHRCGGAACKASPSRANKRGGRRVILPAAIGVSGAVPAPHAEETVSEAVDKEVPYAEEAMAIEAP